MKQDNLLQTIYNNHESLYEQVKVHLEQGADFNRVTSYGESALRVASNNGRVDVIKLLLEHGADEGQLEEGVWV
ncbi:ankyrin repeat domain-containing protein [Microbulbifer sp. 2304DJ12-6]|uniref:ankyrin repeat domain-containing protein n=1 Tax=Microbulbifer sp. 2304DJ12-6 TaxID=3233340 RepID=UPI0026090BE7|nr:ankyrin repeat domain-containing protein [uncultured Microbulbifer sp.]